MDEMRIVDWVYLVMSHQRWPVGVNTFFAYGYMRMTIVWRWLLRGRGFHSCVLTELPVCHSIECHGELWGALSCSCGVAAVRSERIGQLATDCSIGMGIDWTNIILHGV